METVKLIAQAAAEAAANRVSAELRDEQRRGFERMENRLCEKMDGYFGQVDPAKHVVQHDRIERFLTMMDKMGEGIFSNILKNVIWGLIVMSVVGWLAWKKMTGGVA